MKITHIPLLAVLTAGFLPLAGQAQVNSGSDGHDGAFNPTQNVTIDMADHPDGIYHYTSVNIPSGVRVSFKSNSANTPVVWLVQNDCVINGIVGLNGKISVGGAGGLPGPGGLPGGNGGPLATAGQGLGGGAPNHVAGSASYGTAGSSNNNGTGISSPSSVIYGNQYILPLLGGSGGGGDSDRSDFGGGGGGGVVLIAASGNIQINGTIEAIGGQGSSDGSVGTGAGAGSGGAIRLVSAKIFGTGALSVQGGSALYGSGGSGRIRLDTIDNSFSGSSFGPTSIGFQPIILPSSGQAVLLNISSVAGIATPQNPSGILATPDFILPAQLNNPVPITVTCTKLPLNTEITVVIHPVRGSDVLAIGANTVGNSTTSTSTVSLSIPRGSGIIYAKCVSGVAGLAVNASSKELQTKSLAETGWTATGERFAKMEIAAALGGKQQIAFITESGARFAMP